MGGAGQSALDEPARPSVRAWDAPSECKELPITGPLNSHGCASNLNCVLVCTQILRTKALARCIHTDMVDPQAPGFPLGSIISTSEDMAPRTSRSKQTTS